MSPKRCVRGTSSCWYRPRLLWLCSISALPPVSPRRVPSPSLSGLVARSFHSPSSSASLIFCCPVRCTLTSRVDFGSVTSAAATEGADACAIRFCGVCWCALCLLLLSAIDHAHPIRCCDCTTHSVYDVAMPAEEWQQWRDRASNTSVHGNGHHQGKWRVQSTTA